MASETTELTFVRCPSCRSLVPASATRCRICNNPLEAGSKSEDDPTKAGSRVRQKTMTAGPDEVAAAIQKAQSEKATGEAASVVPMGPPTPPASAAQSNEEEIIDPLGAYLEELDEADAAPNTGATEVDHEDPFDLDIFTSDAEQAPVKAKPSAPERPLVRGWDDDSGAESKPTAPPHRSQAIPAPEKPSSQSAPSEAARPEQRVSPRPAQPEARGEVSPPPQQRENAPRDGAPRRGGLNFGGGNGAGGQPAPRPRDEERAPQQQARAEQVPPQRNEQQRPERSEPQRSERVEQPRSERVDAPGQPEQQRQPDQQRRNRDVQPQVQQQQQQQQRRDNQRPEQQRGEPRRDQRNDNNRDGGRERAREERPREERQAETARHEEARVSQPPQSGPRPNQGPRSGKMNAGRLFGWLVSYTEGNGTAIELREGKFFVTSASLKGADLVLDDPSISMPHALMCASGEKGLQVQDLMSDRGVFVRPAEGSQYQREELTVTLEHGDWVRFGDVEFLVTLVPTSKFR